MSALSLNNLKEWQRDVMEREDEINKGKRAIDFPLQLSHKHWWMDIMTMKPHGRPYRNWATLGPPPKKRYLVFHGYDGRTTKFEIE